MSIFHHSAEFIAKHKRHHHLALATLALIIASAGVYNYRQFAQAATFTFNQTSWGGGISATTAAHTTDQTNWTQYSATSTTSVLASGVSLAATNKTIVDDGAGAQIGSNITTLSALWGVAYDITQNAVWVVNRNSAALQKFNAATGAQIGSNITTVSTPVSVTYDITQNAVWVAGGTTLQKFNAVTGAQIGSNITTVGTNITYDITQNAVWVAGGTTLQKFNASTGAQIGSNITITTNGGIAYDITQNAVWVLGGTTLQKFNASTDTQIGSNITITTSSNGYSIAYDVTQNAVWVVNGATATLQKFNAVTGAQIGSNITIAANSGGGIAYDSIQNAVWVTNFNSATLQKFNAATGVQSGSNIATGAGPLGLAYDPTQNAVWVGRNAILQKYIAGVGFEGGAIASTAVTGTSTAASVGLLPAALATGGATSTAGGGYFVHTFTSTSTPGTFQLNTGINVDYLVVGGGAGGGHLGNTGTAGAGGGGGGGGVATGTLTTLTVGTPYTATVGSGGAATSTYGAVGLPGGNSIFSTVTSSGGSAGTAATVSIGGSGGTSGNGLSGGTNGSGLGGGGGGGAGGVGTNNAGAKTGGAGGAGAYSSISGSSVAYGGGGAGGIGLSSGVAGTGGTGGTGGGGSSCGGCSAYNNGSDGFGGGGAGTGAYSVAGRGGSGVVILRYMNYASSGTFTSAVINTGGKSAFTTLSYATTLNGQTITMDARAGNTGTPDGTWTAWQTGIASGGSISGLAGNQYIQYRANLSTTNSAVTPTLDSVTINYNQYATSGNLTSSKYDTGVSTNTFAKVLWAASDTNASSTVTFQVRTSADGSTWTAWCGPTNCSGTDYFTTSNQAIINTTLTDSTNDQWLQYKVFLASGGDITPVLTSATLQYVQNGAPVVSNVAASQITDPANANYGKVSFSFDSADGDTEQGSPATKNQVTPTKYEYYDGSAWHDICTSSCAALSSNAFSSIPLATNATVANTIVVWDPAGTNLYANNTAKIRVTVTDGEGANFLGVGTMAGTFTLDSKKPTIGTGNFSINATAGGVTGNTLTLSASDETNISYRVCNDSFTSPLLPATDTQGNSCAWVAVGAPSLSASLISTNWAFPDATSAKTVNIQVRDQYGNVNTDVTSATAPATPGSFKVADVSNPGANTFGETLSWIASAGATSYNVYSATTTAPTITPSAYTLLANTASNVYPHTISPSASSSAYWYKVSAVGNGSLSSYATMSPGDVPDSFGTAVSDTTAPNVLSVATSSVLSTSAVVTVTTDELASIQIFYSPAGYASGCLYTAHTQPSAIYSTSTVVSLAGLSPSTTYNFCVKATDIAGNVSAGTKGIENSSFTTVSGPGMVGASTYIVTSNTATINWTTSTTSDSYVTYGTPTFGTNNKRIGVSTYTTTTDGSGNFVHAITLTGLTAGNDYYYQVESSNANGTTIDTNAGAYYHFKTTIDTTPPVITGTSTPVLAPNAAVIVWQTDEPATSKIDYGTTLGVYDKGVAEDATTTIWHVMTLSSATANTGTGGGTNALTADTDYYYRITSKDAANNPATADGMFHTPKDGNVTVTVVNVVNSAGDTTKDTTAPAISGVKVSDITPFGATVGFSTSEDAVSFVDYGKDISYGSSKSDLNYGTAHTLKLRGLTLSTDYHLRVKAVDKAGNTGTSDDQIFKTTFLSENLKDMANVENIEQFQKEIESAIESILPSLVPPFVSKPQVSDITESGATVSFKTNIKAFPVVVYAENALYDETKDNPYTGEVSDTVTKDTAHELKLTGLKGNTKYHIQARAFSLPKVIGKSADITFITKASKIAGSIVERKKDSFTVVWTTDEPTSSIVEYKDLKRGITERKVDEAKKTSHSMKIENLPSGTAYEVNLSGMTEQGNIAEAGSPLSVTTSTDTTPPGISGFKVDNALVPGRTDRIQTIVSWMTDEPANGTVYYEEGAGTAGNTAELANKNEVLDSFVTGHSVILPSLKPGTIYRLKVTSSDDSGNLGSFGPRTVITPKQTESITDIIFKNFEDSFKFMRKI